MTNLAHIKFLLIPFKQINQGSASLEKNVQIDKVFLCSALGHNRKLYACKIFKRSQLATVFARCFERVEHVVLILRETYSDALYQPMKRSWSEMLNIVDRAYCFEVLHKLLHTAYPSIQEQVITNVEPPFVLNHTRRFSCQTH